jgi:DNA-binding GntR family transcriptional regulator
MMGDGHFRMESIERPPTLTRATVNAIRRAVFAGRFSPGEPLTEVSLSESLEVSRGTVRTALRELQGEGLVEIIPHRGAFVRRLTPRVVRELYGLRAVLEPFAVRTAFRSGGYQLETLDRLQLLAERIGRFEENPEDSSQPIYTVIEADVGFHQMLFEGSGHALLLRLFEQLKSLMWLSMLDAELYRAYVAEPSHLHIVEALRSGDVDLSQELLVEHIRHAGQVLLDQMRLRSRDPGQPRDQT